jgi:hypothetical protein
MLWKRELRGRVRPTVVQQEDIQALRECLGKGIEEELEHVRMYIWSFEEASVTRGGLARTIDIEPREDMVDAPDRLDAARDEVPPTDGQYTKAVWPCACVTLLTRIITQGVEDTSAMHHFPPEFI